MSETSKKDEKRSVRVAIDDFPSLLVDVTTDYASQAMIDAGFQENTLDRLRIVVRPWIKLYERDFFGIVDDELVKIEKEIRVDLSRQKINVSDFYSALLRLSDGPNRLLWPTRLAMQNAFEHVGVEAKTASPASLRDLWVRLDERVAEIVLRPIARSKTIYGPLREAWRRGSRSQWDNLVGDLIYDRLDVLPGIDSIVEHRLIR